MLTSKTGRLIGTILLLVGAVLLVAVLVTPWYSYAASVRGLPGGGTRNETTTYYPGLPSTSGTIRYSCGGSGFEGSRPCPVQNAYSNEGLNNVGIVAETGFFLVIGAAALGFIAAVLGAASRGSPRTFRLTLVLDTVALLLAISAPVAFALALPAAIGKDLPSHPANGPWSSFFGSGSNAIPLLGESARWGPAVGWYLSVIGAVFFLVGLILLARSRAEPITPVVTTSSSAQVPPA